MRNRILADLASWFSSGGLTEIFQVSQMIWGECAPWQACRGPTGTEVRVRGGTWTRACTVWTWCGLASRASATVDAWCLKQMRDAEAAELAWRRHGGHTVTFRAGTSDRQRGVRYSSRLGCGWGPGQASVQLPSSVNVGWCVAGVAGRNRCQPHCWRGSEASCCCRSGRSRTHSTGRTSAPQTLIVRPAQCSKRRLVPSQINSVLDGLSRSRFELIHDATDSTQFDIRAIRSAAPR